MLGGCLESLVGVWGVEWVFGELGVCLGGVSGCLGGVGGCLGVWVGVWGVWVGVWGVWVDVWGSNQGAGELSECCEVG